jgi:hypothetical protein
VTREVKKSLRYQMVVLVSEDKFQGYSLVGLTETKVSPDFNEAWILRKSDKAHETLENYDEHETFVIKSFVSLLSDKRMSVTEAMCKCLGDYALDLFYPAYGTAGLKGFRKSLFESTEAPKHSKYVAKSIYGRKRYSILSLVRDLEAAGAKIYMEPELVGKYKRISKRVKDGSTLITDNWNQIIGVAGNRTRANLSLQVVSKVVVEVPENEFGVEPGERKLDSIRSFALIRDGVLNMEELGIKTDDTKLIGKLKRLGVLTPMLLMDEYVIDLTKLPVCSSTGAVGSYQLARAEYMVKTADLEVAYLERLIYKLERGLTVLPKKLEAPEDDEATKFLKSLGIFDDRYYSPKTEDLEPEDGYLATEVIGKVEGFPTDFSSNITSFINKGACKNPAVMNHLSLLEPLRHEKNVDVLKKELDIVQTKRKVYITALRELKFKIILGKNLRFSGKGSHSLETYRVNLSSSKVSVTWKVKETTIWR